MSQHPTRRPPAASFFAEDIIALQRLDPNERYVPLRRLCEALGLDPAAQLRRIKAQGVLADGLKSFSLPEENSSRAAPHLRLDLVPFWLAGVDGRLVGPQGREQLELFQRECASLLWHGFKPQGFSAEDALLPPSHEQDAVEQGYRDAAAMATLARHQLLVERQIEYRRSQRDDQAAALAGTGGEVDDRQATLLAQAVRRVATTLAARSRRNEYGGVFSGLYRQFGISSYRRMPAGRLREALEWLERWHGDLLGEPEPPPDI